MEVKEGVWEERVRKNVSAKGLGSHDRIEERFHAKEGEGVFFVKGRKRGSTSICGGPTTKGIYPSIQITPNIASSFCSKKEREVKNGARLSSYKPMDNKERIPPPSYRRHIGWSRKEESIHKARFEVGL